MRASGGGDNLVKAKGAGARDRAGRVTDRLGKHDAEAADLLKDVDDETIASAIRGARDLERRWFDVKPGGTLRLSWPLNPDLISQGWP